MPNTWSELIPALEEVSGRILRPDLLGAGVVGGPYILLASEFEDASTGWYGCTHQYLAATRRKIIGKRWRGLGPACVLNDAVMNTDRQEFSFEDGIVPLATAIVCHELFGHTPQFGYCKEPPPEDLERASIALQTSISRRDEDTPGFIRAVQNSRHDWRFIRRCLNGAHRLKQAGWPCPLSQILDCWGLGLSSIYGYGAELGDEPERMELFSLSQIEHTTPPAGFMELYAADVSRRQKSGAAA